MARIRTIKPEFPESESMGRVSRDARLLFILLWTASDDAGRLRGNSRMLASRLLPYDEDAPSLIDGWLAELVREKSIVIYKVDGQTYIQIRNWLIHQKIDKPSKSKIPPCDGFSWNGIEDSAKAREDSRGSIEDSSEEGKGMEWKGMEGKGEDAADTEFKISLEWKPSQDAKELIKIARGKLPTDDAMRAHLANFVGYWRTRDDARRQDQWDHSFSDWVVKKESEEQRKNLRPEEIYINVLGQQIDTADKAWELFKNDNDQHTPERFRIDKEATRAARKQVAA